VKIKTNLLFIFTVEVKFPEKDFISSYKKYINIFLFILCLSIKLKVKQGNETLK
jgi:hypothetical protein